MKDGPYTPKVTATDAANNKSAVFDGTPFKVDTSAEKNEPDNDPNATSVIDIVSITVDSGQNKTDFYTNDNQLLFNGTLKNFTDNGDGTVTDRGSGLIWQQRDDRYSELRASLPSDPSHGKRRVEMSYIGG